MLVIILLSVGCGRFNYDLLPLEGQGGSPGQAVRRPSDAGADRTGSGSSCALGYADCDGNPDNGCETSTSSALTSCGACSTHCDNDHGTARCVAGVCEAECAPGFGDCDGDPSNGCEQALDTPAHCAACGVACSDTHAGVACSDGRCSPTCASGYGDCDGDPNTGCEADLANNPAHCGSCSNACTAGLICVAGSCVASRCPSGRGDCDADPSTCEVALDTSAAHCGFCNNSCSAANGTSACVDGACRVQSCEGGFGDCDGSPSNGCETALASADQHCGTCGAPCTNPNGITSCRGSSCAPVCSTGFGDCDGSRQNGCETSLLGSVDHCGTCGVVCPANGGTPVCNAGVCGTLCDLDGTFALKLSATGSWPSGQYLKSGSGTFHFWLKAELDHSGSTLAAAVTECGRIKPPITNTANETHVYGFPNSLFDNGYLTATSVTATLSTSSPGAVLAWPLTSNLMGISLTNPNTDPWPSSASQVPSARRIDMDRDGKTGVTGSYDSGDFPRTSAAVFGFNRADLFYFASRLSFSLNGSLTSCSAASGSATVNDFDMRILGCNRANSTQDCTTSESDFLDSVTPTITMTSGTYALTRVAAGAGCADVRAALP